MGRLAGFKYREVASKLRAFGFTFDRPGPGSHDLPNTKCRGRVQSALECGSSSYRLPPEAHTTIGQEFERESGGNDGYGLLLQFTRKGCEG